MGKLFRIGDRVCVAVVRLQKSSYGPTEPPYVCGYDVMRGRVLSSDGETAAVWPDGASSPHFADTNDVFPDADTEPLRARIAELEAGI